MEGAEGTVGQVEVILAATNGQAKVNVSTMVHQGDSLTLDPIGQVRTAEAGEDVFAYASEDFDPWPDNCVVIEDEFDAPGRGSDA